MIADTSHFLLVNLSRLNCVRFVNMPDGSQQQTTRDGIFIPFEPNGIFINKQGCACMYLKPFPYLPYNIYKDMNAVYGLQINLNIQEKLERQGCTMKDTKDPRENGIAYEFRKDPDKIKANKEKRQQWNQKNT